VDQLPGGSGAGRRRSKIQPVGVIVSRHTLPSLRRKVSGPTRSGIGSAATVSGISADCLSLKILSASSR